MKIKRISRKQKKINRKTRFILKELNKQYGNVFKLINRCRNASNKE